MSEGKGNRSPKELDHDKSKLGSDLEKSKKENSNGYWTTIWVLLLAFIAVTFFVCSESEFF